METPTTENLLLEIEELKNRLFEAEQLIEAIKAGEVDAFAFNKNDQIGIFTLQSGDYAYRVLVENFSEGALNLSEDGLIVYTNTSFHEILQLPYEKVIGKNILQFIHPDSTATFNELFKKGLAGQSKGEINLVAANVRVPVYVSLTSLYPTLSTVGVVIYDLREKKAHEQTLVQKKELEIAKKSTEDSEKRYNMMLMQSPFAFAIFSGEDLVITLANDSMKDVLGKGKDIENKPLLKVLPELEGQPFAAYMQKVKETGIPFYANDALAKLYRNGKLEDVYFNFVYQPYWEVDGSISGITCIAYEVTNEVIAKRKIEESENQLRRFKDQLELSISAGKIGIWNLDIKKNYLHWSKEQCELYGITEKEFEHTPEAFWKFVNPSDLLEKQMESENNFKSQNPGLTQQFRITRADGAERWIESRTRTQYDAAGQPEFITGINIDITDDKLFLEELDRQVADRTFQLKQSEEKFNKLFSASPLGLILTEKKSNKVVDANENYFETIGYSRQECIGKTSLELKLVDAGDRQKIIDDLQKNGFVKNAQVNLHAKSGKVIPILNSIEQISIGDKEYFLSAIVDITDRKNAEQKIEEKNAELQKMNKELEAFNYISSHDLQEPLRKIQTFAGRIADREKDKLSETAKDYFNRMNDAATRMQTLIRDLLSFSRLASTESKFEVTNIGKIIDEVKEDFKEKLEEKKATVEKVHMCEASIIPFQFRQLFQNLISNSLKFIKPGVPPHITINSSIISSASLPHHWAERLVCQITYTDNGIGFEQHFSEKIFQVFQKLHGKDQYPGTGIGLAIVKKIVENHNGIITAESKLGEGVTFNICFPAK